MRRCGESTTTPGCGEHPCQYLLPPGRILGLTAWLMTSLLAELGRATTSSLYPPSSGPSQILLEDHVKNRSQTHLPTSPPERPTLGHFCVCQISIPFCIYAQALNQIKNTFYSPSASVCSETACSSHWQGQGLPFA